MSHCLRRWHPIIVSFKRWGEGPPPWRPAQPVISSSRESSAPVVHTRHGLGTLQPCTQEEQESRRVRPVVRLDCSGHAVNREIAADPCNQPGRQIYVAGVTHGVRGNAEGRTGGGVQMFANGGLVVE